MDKSDRAFWWAIYRAILGMAKIIKKHKLGSKTEPEENLYDSEPKALKLSG